ncbi:MAG: spermidine/putrescine ABC transporter substrate-binding protein [Planctomycetes bacterium]|nr:spermidine/putrescine ABC transporter substrate-binding protein [Planctomycetota bacterium]
MNFTSLGRSLAAWMGVSACLCLSACKDKSPSAQGGGNVASAAPVKELNVYMWSEYIDPTIVSDFERATGMKVRIDVYEDTETMLAKMQHQEGDKLYDVVIASDHAIPTLGSLHLIKPLELARIPNAVNVEARFKTPQYDPKGEFSLPYQWGTVGLIYFKDKLGSTPLSWNLVLGPAPAGSFVLIDSMRDMMGAALKLGGYSVNTTDAAQLDAAGKLILAAKEHKACLGFEGGVGGKNKVAAGIASCAVVYSGDALRAVAEDSKLAYGVPVEGSIIWVDAMTVTARARNEAGAYAFINTILDAKVGAKLSSWTLYATPNAKAKELLPAEAASNPAIYPPEAAMAKLEYITELGDAIKQYDAVWTGVKAK